VQNKMIEAAFIFLILFSSIFCEVIFGSFGLIFPVSACTIFYISVNYPWKLSVVLSLIVGLLIDVLFGRHGFQTSYLLFFIVIFGVYWLHKGVLKVLKVQIIPGIIIGLIYAGPQLFSSYFTYESGFLLFFFKILNLVLTIFMSGILLPVIVLLFDYFSQKLGLSVYAKAKEKLYKNSR
jgi:hypothetical protein